jgi:chitinase
LCDTNVLIQDSNAASLYSQFTDLKGTYNGLQTWISVGGWSFTDRKHIFLPHNVQNLRSVTDLHVPAGVTRNAFSNMAASETNTQTFINGLIKFMDTYGFDGIDLDWEYPAADDRGGVPADFTNYVSLVKAIRLAFGTKYGFSITLPTSYWYLQHFDLANIQDSVDWFNFMAYDLHGTSLVSLNLHQKRSIN